MNIGGTDVFGFNGLPTANAKQIYEYEIQLKSGRTIYGYSYKDKEEYKESLEKDIMGNLMMSISSVSPPNHDDMEYIIFLSEIEFVKISKVKQ